MLIALPLLVCLIGLVMFIIADNPPGHSNVKEIGRIMFFCGLLVLLFKGLEPLLNITK
jgi:hypothetical protein